MSVVGWKKLKLCVYIEGKCLSCVWVERSGVEGFRGLGWKVKGMAGSTASSATGRRRKLTLSGRQVGDVESEDRRFCHCGLVAPLCTSWTEVNPGRRFYGCGNFQLGRGCGFFQWHDSEMGERSKEVINELLGRVDRMYHENKRESRGCIAHETSGESDHDVADIMEELKKTKRRLRVVVYALALTWFFFYVFVMW